MRLVFGSPQAQAILQEHRRVNFVADPDKIWCPVCKGKRGSYAEYGRGLGHWEPCLECKGEGKVLKEATP